ncbi:MAG TPA: glycosyl transferase, partial [Anaerolineae bacterium]|nr:glycosyl transferase [Anaerolineae bacterium]
MWMIKPVPSEQMNPLVSVIIPNFNHARFLGDAIRSVVGQDYKNVEVIVVDDGSTDNSREVVEQFGDKVKYIYQENAGLSAARNTGIRASKGSLIGVLDADDMYEPVFLSTLVADLQSNPKADGIYCGYQFVDQKNNLLPQIEARHVASELLYNALLDGNFFVPESIFLHRYVYDEVGLFDEALRACEDWDVWLRVTNKFRIIHT